MGPCRWSRLKGGRFILAESRCSKEVGIARQNTPSGYPDGGFVSGRRDRGSLNWSRKPVVLRDMSAVPVLLASVIVDVVADQWLRLLVLC